ncbi:MAG: hypothetical protein HC810_00190 [Acaryochloridaceae cyanobacterium RL_2_7]|nr:hypothetical protein [Acaryochloridaceae cyanobacterium RL_2_7]
MASIITILPPHVVRGLADTLGSVLAKTLREDVERSLAPTALSETFQRNLEAKLARLTLQTITPERVIDLAGQLTLGSTFNPDQLTGIQVQIIPALDRFAPQEQTRSLDLPTVVTGGSVQARSQIQSLQPWSQSLVFQGSGADYRVQANMAKDSCSSTEMLNSLNVSMLSGDDGLRDNSSLALELEVAGRGSILVPFGGGDGDRRFNTMTRPVTIPPIARRDLRGVGLRFTSRSGFLEDHDNWTLSAIQVRGNGRTLTTQSGRPVFRFSKDTPRFMTDVSCTPSLIAPLPLLRPSLKPILR